MKKYGLETVLDGIDEYLSHLNEDTDALVSECPG